MRKTTIIGCFCVGLTLAALGCETVLVYTTPPGPSDSGPSGATTLPTSPDSGASAPLRTASDSGCGAPDDANNCGVCRHSCFGGACVAGVCHPVVLASGQGDAMGAAVTGFDGGAQLVGPGRIATDGAFVFWLNLRGEVMRVPVSGGEPSRVAVTAGRPAWIELDTSFVYFMSATTGTIFRVAKTGGNPVELTPPPPPHGVGNEFLIHAGNLYWADTVADYTCPVSGCNGRAKSLWLGPNAAAESPVSLTVISDALIYVSALDTGSGGGGIDMPTAGSPCINVPPNLSFVELHSDDAHIYGLSDNSVIRGSCYDVGGPTYLASGLAGAPHGLAIDEAFVYWVNTGSQPGYGAGPNAIQRCAKTGCAAPEVLASETASANGIALDTGSVYWTTGDGNVKRLAKPARAASTTTP